MFNVGPQEMLVLLLVGVIVFGPDKLPAIARQAAQMIRALRDMSDNARKQISELSPELGEQLGDLSALRKKGVGGLSASSALQRMIFDGDDDPLGMKAHSRDDGQQPPGGGESAPAAIPLVKQHDAAQVAGAAAPIPETAPAPRDASVAAAGDSDDDSTPSSAEPRLERAPMLGAARGQRAVPPAFDDVT
jgi:sec-independent protein translocase protein TatB